MKKCPNSYDCRKGVGLMQGDDIWKAGIINQKVVSLLSLDHSISGSTIYVGNTNLDHMKDDHPDDYEIYGNHLYDILKNPTYVALHPSNGSIQYIKVFEKDGGEDYVLVGVRLTRGGKRWFARTMFIMSDEKVDKYTKKNSLKKY